ncbi:hypothetical protein SNEBB_002368 [Seison nebaliae]|nr:hypothetical protein SNEBB_002368 [Seison nebaliae]
MSFHLLLLFIYLIHSVQSSKHNVEYQEIMNGCRVMENWLFELLLPPIPKEISASLILKNWNEKILREHETDKIFKSESMRLGNQFNYQQLQHLHQQIKDESNSIERNLRNSLKKLYKSLKYFEQLSRQILALNRYYKSNVEKLFELKHNQLTILSLFVDKNQKISTIPTTTTTQTSIHDIQENFTTLLNFFSPYSIASSSQLTTTSVKPFESIIKKIYPYSRSFKSANINQTSTSKTAERKFPPQFNQFQNIIPTSTSGKSYLENLRLRQTSTVTSTTTITPWFTSTTETMIPSSSPSTTISPSLGKSFKFSSTKPLKGSISVVTPTLSTRTLLRSGVIHNKDLMSNVESKTPDELISILLGLQPPTTSSNRIYKNEDNSMKTEENEDINDALYQLSEKTLTRNEKVITNIKECHSRGSCNFEHTVKCVTNEMSKTNYMEKSTTDDYDVFCICDTAYTGLYCEIKSPCLLTNNTHLYPHPNDDSLFIKCFGGLSYLFPCPQPMVYNAYLKRCVIER